MTDLPSDILSKAQETVARISSRMEASSTLGDAATEVIAEALMARDERAAKICDRLASDARAEADAFGERHRYTEANHWNGYAQGIEDVARAIRSLEKPVAPDGSPDSAGAPRSGL